MAKTYLPFRLLGFFMVMLLAITGCQKDPMTFPAKVQFEFGMITTASDSQAADGIETRNGSITRFTFNQGSLAINDISFEGRRQDADDVFFNAPMDPVVVVNLAEGTSNQAIEFDIPQGIYKRMEFIFEIGSPQHIPLVVSGTANIGGLHGEIPLRFEYEFAEPVRVVAKAKGQENNEDILLQKENPATARLEIDAEFLFRLISPGMMINADIEELEGHPEIIINSSKNPSLFNMVAARVDQSFKITFE